MSILLFIGMVLIALRIVADIYVAVGAVIITMILALIAVFEED